jgi:hypothetical protein
MILTFYTIFGMGLGLGMGTVLGKHLMVKSVEKHGKHSFKWNSKTYIVKQKP